MSAIGISTPRIKGFTPAAFANWGHDRLMFERQQSLSLRQMEWEKRVKPMLPWSVLLARGLGVAVVAAVFLAFLL